jgi:hypothetical protein
MAAPPTPADVFSSSEQLFDRLVVLTNEALFTANPEKAQLKGIATAVPAAAPAVKSVVPDAEEIAFKSISSVKANRHRSDLNVYYHDGSRDRMKNIDFDTAAIRDRAFEGFRRRLGPRFVKDEVQYSVLSAAFAPLLAVVVFAAVTMFMMGAAQELKDGVEVKIRGGAVAAKGIFVVVLGVLGPTGVMILGGLFVLGGIAWLVARLRKPPLMAILTAKKP